LAFSEVYRKQVELLIRILPFIAEEDCFALKGGTAVNLFVGNMPRLSVDIDLTYLPVLPRAESLVAIDAAMKRIAERIRKGLRGATVTEGAIQPEKAVTKLLIRVGGVQTKIEVTPVLRGCVLNRNCSRSLAPWKRRSGLRKYASCRLRIYMVEKSWLLLTANIRATSLMSATFLRMKALTKRYVVPSSFTCLVITDQCSKCLPRGENPSKLSSAVASKV
jgi:hypothetical protein